MTQTKTCPDCHGIIHGTRRTTTEHALAVHRDTCPARGPGRRTGTTGPDLDRPVEGVTKPAQPRR